jgi:hypothetical protein
MKLLFCLSFCLYETAHAQTSAATSQSYWRGYFFLAPTLTVGPSNPVITGYGILPPPALVSSTTSTNNSYAAGGGFEFILGACPSNIQRA